MGSAVPEVMKAVVIEEGHTVSIKDHPVPPLSENDVLIKTVAVALNPTDWKHVDSHGKPGTVLGCDFSGVVVKVGKSVVSPKVGDQVAGFTHGGAFADEGAFAEYIKIPSDLLWVVPENTFSHEEAATLGCAYWTAVQALYHPTRLALVEPPAKASAQEWILIYGGSSAVGQCAIQLAHLSGYKVVTTASPRNFELVKSLGATAVFDYNDPEVVSKIREATGDSITKALDTIALKEAQAITVGSIAPSGGKVIVLLAPQPDATNRKDVEVMHTLLYTCLGRTFAYGGGKVYPASDEDRTHMAAFLKKLPSLVRDGAVKPLPIKLWDGGLLAIPDGLQYLREGNISAQKIVYRL